MTLATALAAVGIAAGCGSSSKNSASPTETGSEHNGMTTAGDSMSAGSGDLVMNGQYSDKRFIDMMVPHHLEAVRMARVAEANAEHSELKQLAANIISSQQVEISEMKAIRKRVYGSATTPTKMSDQMMENTGMMMGDDLASEKPFDRAFIDSMIPHHASAIDMASVALMHSEKAKIRKIARAIVDAQSMEIGEMIKWRKGWYPGG